MEEIQNLINQMFEEEKEDEDILIRNTELRRKLRRIGPEIVDPILTKLFAFKKNTMCYRLSRNNPYGGWPLYHLVKLAAEFAEHRHAQQFAKMLFWDEIRLADYHATLEVIIEVMQRIGSRKIVPSLKAFERLTQQVYEYLLDKDKKEGHLTHMVRYYQELLKKIAETIKICRAQK